MTNEQAKELIKNDCVIVRNDGVVIQNALGDYLIFSPNESISMNKKIKELETLAKKIGAEYIYHAVKFVKLPLQQQRKNEYLQYL